MKKIIIIFFLVFSCQIFAQDTNSMRYLPLKVGNCWVYVENISSFCSLCPVYTRYTISGTSQINGRNYFNVTSISKYKDSSCMSYCGHSVSKLYSTSLINLDSLTGNIYIQDTCANGLRLPLDSLRAKKGDSLSICMFGLMMREVCLDTVILNIFGLNRKTKSFNLPHASGGEGGQYAMDIGLYKYSWGESFSSWSETLLGCVINGVVYGDTSMLVGINQLSSEVPHSFSLSQNYPNPFNPTTNINFSVPQKAFVTITIYNVLGKEISKLVNKEFSPGTYETNWDAENFPSGMYYYKLVVGDNTNNGGEQLTIYSETKKMVFLK